MGAGDRHPRRSHPRARSGGSSAAARVALIAALALAACGEDEDGGERWLAPAADAPLRVRHLANDPVSGHGIGVEDLDGDGLLDVVVTTGFGSVRAFRNEGGLAFSDLTGALGMADLRANAVAVRDVTGDGAPDVVLAGDDGVRLLANDGTGAMTDVTDPAGLSGIAVVRPVHVLPADLDVDGDVDLFVSSYGGANLLLLQAEDGTFSDVAASAGVTGEEHTWCASLWDQDGDGSLEIYLATDTFEEDVHGGPEWSVDRTSPSSDRLYRRDIASPEPRWYDVSSEVRIDVARSTMGALVADLDRDATLDLFTTDFGRNHALRTAPDGGIDHATDDLGLAAFVRQDCPRVDDPSFCALVSWGAARFDADADGVADLIVANGGLEQDWRGRQPLSAYRGLAEGGFEPVRLPLEPMAARAIVAADLDRDGDEDVLVSRWNGPLLLLEAPGVPTGNTLRVTMRGNVAGAVVTLAVDDGTMRTASVASGGVIQSSRPAEAHFDLGSARPTRLTVTWPTGDTERIDSPGPAVELSH